MPQRRSSWPSLALLVLLTEVVYFPASVLRAGLFGADYSELHGRHIEFAREALFGPGHFLPGWYPRDLLGAPFAANIQSFPWIPTRLILLLFDPQFAYGVGVAVAAALASIFTYLFCKRVGLSEVGAISAGWTFACAGFFASRVMAGHLPMLEAYPALPLLLWLADRALAGEGGRFQVRDLAALALAAACVVLAGHPQLPAYAIAAAVLYLILRGRGRRLVLAVSSLALGLGLALFALYPMVSLIRRSTRVLSLAPASNDIAMPYGRLLALAWPSVHGFPELMQAESVKLFQGYPSTAYFWDTVSYLGVLPLAAIVLLLGRSLVKKRLPSAPFAFLVILGIGAFFLSLPAAQPIYRTIPGTFLRSPSRLFYLCTFAASVALGCAVSLFMAGGWYRARIRQAIVLVCLVGHAADLGSFARLFVQPAERDDIPRSFQEILDRELGSQRIAAEDMANHGRYDDAGIFESILLANPYRAMLGLAGLPVNANEQVIDAAGFPIPALQAAGVGFVITSEARPELALVSSTEEERLYRVPDPFPRAAFFTGGQVDFLFSNAVLDRFIANPRRDTLLLPLDAERAYTPGAPTDLRVDTEHPVEAKYSRPSSDEIHVETAPEQPGFVAVLESYDPGWRASVDGVAAPLVMANGFSMAVPVRAGRHAIVLRYDTPGRRLGILLSLASGILLACLLWIASKNENPA